jgi:hypothetical protein
MNAFQRLIDMPITGKLNLFTQAGFTFLLTSGILTRTVIGVTRVVADAPPLNPLPIPEKDKDRTFLERMFTEGVGSLALTYGVLYVVQDIAAKGVQTLDKTLAPARLIDACKPHLDEDQLAQFTQAVTQAFGGEKAKLNLTHNAIYHNLYGQGKIAHLATLLKQPELLRSEGGFAQGKLAEAVTPYFKNLNGKGVFCLMAGTGFSAWLSGGPLQAWNDGWFRNNVTLKVLDAYTHWKEQHQPAAVAPKPTTSPQSPVVAQPTPPPVRPQPGNTWAVPMMPLAPMPAALSLGGLR